MAGPKAITAKGSKPKAQKKTPRKVGAKSPRSRRATAQRKMAQPKKAVDQVVAAAKSVIKSTKAQSGKSKPTKAELKVFAELESLAAYIQAAKLEIAQIRPDTVKDEHLLTAIDELDAVVEASADATNTIMDACEIVEGVMGDVPSGTSGKLMDATTQIYEACTFQDITGQRINKVVKTMRHIEDRIDALIDAFGDKPAGAKKKAKVVKKTAAPKPGAKKVISDADLLDGPQLGDKVKSQSEIDDIFANFD